MAEGNAGINVTSIQNMKATKQRAKKTVIIYSGGMDSTALLYSLLRDGAEVYALSINYGQRHRRELVAAVEIVSEAVTRGYRLQHKIVDLSALKPLLAGSSQSDDSVPVPHGHYAEESMKQTVVPNRNMIMLAVAGAWAISVKADSISYAAHMGDHTIYPDCRDEFCIPLSQALWHADWHHVKLERPFLQMSKADIVTIGTLVGAPISSSYSCYEGGAVHCGKCGTCVERREAFKIAKVKDMTEYKA